MYRVSLFVLTTLCFTIVAGIFFFVGQATGDHGGHETSRWRSGIGWGWVWGSDDEVGALNAMNPNSVRAALQLPKKGKVYDLGITYSRNSFKWLGHNSGEIMTFRSPEGVKRQADYDFVTDESNKENLGWHSCALFISPDYS